MRGPLSSAVVVGLAWLVIGELGVFEAFGVSSLTLWPAALALGYLVGKSPWAPWVSRFGAALISIVALIAFTPLMNALTASIRQPPLHEPPPVDAVMVLSAAVTKDTLLSPNGADRLLYGVELARRGVARVLITSRVRRGQTLTSDSDQRRILAFLPDSVAWMIIDSATNTRQEALATSRLAARQGWTRVAIVTSHLHLRRACAAFGKLLDKVECLAAPGRDIAFLTMNTPGDRIKAFGPWLHEFIGWYWYRIRGWI